MRGIGEGRIRLCPIEIYSEGIRPRIYEELLPTDVAHDKWSWSFWS